MHTIKLIFLISALIISPQLCAATPQLEQNPGWSGKNRDQLNTIINHYGINSSNYNSQNKPVAAFDWDNTLMKNDIGEATLLWMMTHNKLKRPESFKQMNPWLSDIAIQNLEKNCVGTARYLPAANKPECADTILDSYHNKTLAKNQSFWKISSDPERIFPPYFFYAQLFAGYTPNELSELTQQALTYSLKNKIGAVQKVGTKLYPAYVRLYEPMHNLISVLQDNGFEVWIISASIQPSVEVVAAKAGIKPDHVIGVRQTLDKEGRLTDSFQGCGPYPDGNKEIISNRVGKRCWLNKIVFKIPAEQQITKAAPIIFAAGDSEGDLILLKDATGGRLVINKNNPELLCYAYQNLGGKWLINPMFIEPKPINTKGYNCGAFNISDQFEVKK